MSVAVVVYVICDICERESRGGFKRPGWKGKRAGGTVGRLVHVCAECIAAGHTLDEAIRLTGSVR